ncbi:electron transfer flavoprotein subunit alpha/FixB family protein [Serratia microhaemolytica]|uniref:electron transfer flavoprotein subunit alpha/FixB family protein n=1 Tax=Serratia microhaemolytica TaxID=2675110 RepID=UPI000FDEF344|nr:electron transfer flavoprotein subunit alpha/FixB family protein [Serratia microhaemolytica]
MSKIAIILDADAHQFSQHASQIAQFLQRSELHHAQVELWLFSQSEPLQVPTFADQFSARQSSTPQSSTPQHAVLQLSALRWLKAANVSEARLALLTELQQQVAASLLLFAGEAGSEWATRLAYRCGGSACCEVTQAALSATECLVSKAVYSNHLKAQLRMAAAPWCLSVARTASQPLALEATPLAAQPVTANQTPATHWLLHRQQQPISEPPALLTARRVLVVGQGAASAQNVAYLQQVATALSAEFAASRPVVMNGWCEMDRLVGMSGAIIAPEICIAAGVSGAPAFAIGIRHSKLIIAINHDPQAAIFAQADVGIVGEMNPVLAALVAKLQPKRNITP